MVLTKTPICNFGEKTKSFELKGVDGKRHKPVSYTHLTLPTICSV